MKLTKDKLKSLIREVVAEKRRNSIILSESMEQPPMEDESLPSSPTFEKIMNILQGQDPSVRTVIIMSGQNPMAEETDSAKNAMLAKKLEAALSDMGLQFIPIGGRFSGHDEDSVVILNPTREQGHQLNRSFKQWGYVWGQDLPNFQMIKIDHDQPQGEGVDPDSKVATAVDASAQAQKAVDNYSFDYVSGRKFIISLY